MNSPRSCVIEANVAGNNHCNHFPVILEPMDSIYYNSPNDPLSIITSPSSPNPFFLPQLSGNVVKMSERKPSTSDALKNTHSIPAAIAGLSEVRRVGGQPQPTPDNPGGYLPYGLSPLPATPDTPDTRPQQPPTQSRDVQSRTSQSLPASQATSAAPSASVSSSAASSQSSRHPPPHVQAPQKASTSTVQTSEVQEDVPPAFLDITELPATLQQPAHLTEFKKFLLGLDAKGKLVSVPKKNKKSIYQHEVSVVHSVSL